MNGKSLFNILNFNLKKTLFITFFVIVFYETFIKLGNIFHPVKIVSGSFCDIAQPFKVFTSQY